MQEIILFIHNHFILSLAWLILLSAVIITIFQSQHSKVSNLSRSEAIELINKKNAVIIDLRNRDHYCKGHIVNSLNLEKTDIQSGNLKILEKVKGKPVIIVCETGIISRDTKTSLIKAGLEPLYVLQEGILGWHREHLPLVKNK